jgi:16S rRNA (adenine1518-N6/adenine1519-N6)-dimethyltransferase
LCYQTGHSAETEIVLQSYSRAKRMSLTNLLKKYDLAPKRSLGQNFLADAHHLSKIVGAAGLTATDLVIEIGPGPGLLTQRLAEQAGQVIAVELDEQMVRMLRAEYGHIPNLTVVHADILKTNLGELVRTFGSREAVPGELRYKVVANLPYYITSAAIRHLLESDPPPQRVVITIQKEVAERIVAKPGQMSLLAVSVQFYGEPRLVHRIPAGAFYPPPKVDSAVIQIDSFQKPIVETEDVGRFFRIVKAGFSQKRKQLKNTLAAGLQLPGDTVQAALREADIDPRRRAQSLSLEEWGRLDRALS